MTEATFRFSTNILRRLGEELNPSPGIGILELVKNAYDADALNCTIELLQTNNAGGAFRVVDDGVGMSIDQITDGWLVLGKSEKNSSVRTHLGRFPAGDKGLGRLAALRLGDKASLCTRPKSKPGTEFELTISWEEFDQARLVEDVGLEILSRSTKLAHGSEITVENLRSPIGEVDIKKLARALVLLADPFGDDPSGFHPKLVVPEFQRFETLVSSRYFDQADYHLSASVDLDGRVSAETTDWKGNVLFSANHDEIAAKRNRELYSCPPTQFDVWVFLLDAEKFKLRNITIGEVRTWLSEFGGVHLFHNGIRVSPYGDTGFDWLDINVRRSQNPEERPSTNTLIGRVFVKDQVHSLVQKTDRSGFIEDQSFQELRLFAQDSLEWLANRRLEVAQKRRLSSKQEAKEKSSRTETRVRKAIDELPKKQQGELIEAFSAYERARQKEVETLHKEVQLYRTLSTVGIMAATFAHESSGNSIKLISQAINTIERRARKLSQDEFENLLSSPVEAIKASLGALSVLGIATLRLLDHDKRRIGRVDLNHVVAQMDSTFKPFLVERDVELKIQLADGGPYLRGSEAAVESIITNLINNSLAAFEHAGTNHRQIHLITYSDEEIYTLVVTDNGPGIEGISLKDIWLPGRSTRLNGTGLGLAIVKDTVSDLGGKVSAREHGDLGGAEITVELPILGR
ncbi:MAG: histidine kinase [Anaerolineae bacterium]|nr:MAG: histidine kinase [Anaerolineae bacterium]